MDATADSGVLRFEPPQRSWACDQCGNVYVPGETRACSHLAILEPNRA